MLIKTFITLCERKTVNVQVSQLGQNSLHPSDCYRTTVSGSHIELTFLRLWAYLWCICSQRRQTRSGRYWSIAIASWWEYAGERSRSSSAQWTLHLRVDGYCQVCFGSVTISLMSPWCITDTCNSKEEDSLE